MKGNLHSSKHWTEITVSFTSTHGGQVKSISDCTNEWSSVISYSRKLLCRLTCNLLCIRFLASLPCPTKCLCHVWSMSITTSWYSGLPVIVYKLPYFLWSRIHCSMDLNIFFWQICNCKTCLILIDGISRQEYMAFVRKMDN